MMKHAALTRRAVVVGLAATSLATPTLAQTPALRTFSRGARVPPGLKDRIKAQNATATAIDELLKADAAFVTAIGNDSPLLKPAQALPPQFTSQATPVKDQMRCGSCWAFAAIGAYEAAYLLTNKKFVDVSEQQALDCTFADNNCIAGGWHEPVFVYLQLLGLVGADVYPYHEAKQICTSNVPRQYFALNWGYVVESDAPTPHGLIPPDTALKQAIYRYGTIAAAVQTVAPTADFKSWDSYRKRYDTGEMNPNWPTDFPNAVFTGIPSKNLAPDQADHEVLMVGWDDKLGCWIIKNSWGVNWGDEGYIRLPYGCNNIGLGASWITVRPDTAISPALVAQMNMISLRSQLGEFYPAINQLK